MEHSKEALAAGGPPPQRGNKGGVPSGMEIFGVPKAAVWGTRRQAKNSLKK